MKVFGLGVVLMLTNYMSEDGHTGPGIIVQHLVECVSLCYHNITCSGLFYDEPRNLCYSTLKVHVNVDRLIVSRGVKHYAFTSADCPIEKGYTYIRGSNLCVKMSEDQYSPDEATKQCSTEGGFLVRISNPLQQAAVFSSFFDCFWIEGRRDLTHDTYWWTNKQQMSYFPWYPDFPKTTSTLVNLITCMKGWKNVNSSLTFKYMCEIPTLTCTRQDCFY